MRLTPVTLSRYMRRFIERQSFQGFHYRCPIRGWVTVKYRKHPYYGEHRPWTEEFKHENAPNMNLHKIYVRPIKEWTVFHGDRVEILVGKDKGKQGIINSVIKERNWVYVEGCNCEFEMKPSFPGMPSAGQMKEKPLLYPSQVKLVDPGTEAPTEIEWRFTEKGEKVRVSSTSGRIIPLPAGADIGEDLIVPSLYKENKDVDTLEKDVTEITFKPKLKTFEQDIMDQMGIKDDRKQAKTYWY